MAIRNSVVAALALTLAGAFPAVAQPPESDAKAAIDQTAITALKAMGEYLRGLKGFQVDVATSDEDVLEDGAKIQYVGTASILAMPNRLRAEVDNERIHRLYLYDGKSFTLYAERLNYYATVPAPPTVRELIKALEEHYDASVPLVDLFRWGGPESSTAAITAAMDIGPSAVLGTSCEHYVFRQSDIDWQLWIQKGDYPLPRKIVITTKTDDARPQHEAVYTWNLAPSFNEGAFTFDPPPGAARVKLAEISPAPAAGK